MAKVKGKKRYTFGHLLITYNMVLIISVVLLGTILFAIVFRQLSTLQQQNNRYTIVSELASSLSKQRESFNRLVFSQQNTDINDSITQLAIEDRTARTKLKELSTTYETSPEQYYLLRGIENGLDFIKEQKGIILSSIPLDSTGFARYYTIDKTYQYLYEYVYARFLSNAVALDAKAVGEMRESISFLRSISLILIIGLFAIYTLAVIAIVRSLVHPIEKMVYTASEITKGNLETPDLGETGPSEIQFLENTLNSMKKSLIERMNAINENAILEKKLHQQELSQIKVKRELDRARLVTLQAQINPHFLFNAMNSISRTALFEEAEKTRELVNTLALLFRYMFDMRSAVTLAEEIDFVEKYLKIQKVRFQDRLEYSITKESKTDSLLIPPLLIQPFVENAIVHGLEPLESGGSVAIHITHSQKILSIDIIDNGVGYDNSLHNGNTTSPHFGIANVSERIKLYYGEKGNVSIKQHEEKGTTVSLTLPIRKRDWL
ncbi:MAG: sensor histidine kinase [Spirochaetia bacterium]|nr:sensor histidine kinase [Spirochaetia bacterium]